MNTQENVEKTVPTRKVPTEIEYHEKGHWTKGENIITVMGGLPSESKAPIAHIKLEDYDENKKPILIALDLEGAELFERTSNLYQLKKLIRDQEQRLTKEMIIRNNTPVLEVAQPVETPALEQTTEAVKTNSIRKVRRSKDSNEQSQSISH